MSLATPSCELCVQQLQSAFLTAQVEGNKVVYSIVLTNAKNPLSREEVETHFESELSKLSPKPS
jgi:hypothetical protein